MKSFTDRLNKSYYKTVTDLSLNWQFWNESNVKDGGRNYLWRLTENINEWNIQRRIWEAIEKPTKSCQWEFWYHHDRNKESSERYKLAKSKSRATEAALEEKVAKAEKKVEKL